MTSTFPTNALTSGHETTTRRGVKVTVITRFDSPEASVTIESSQGRRFQLRMASGDLVDLAGGLLQAHKALARQKGER